MNKFTLRLKKDVEIDLTSWRLVVPAWILNVMMPCSNSCAHEEWVKDMKTAKKNKIEQWKHGMQKYI